MNPTREHTTHANPDTNEETTMTTTEKKIAKTTRNTHTEKEATMKKQSAAKAHVGVAKSETTNPSTAAPEVAAATTSAAVSIPLQIEAIEQSCGYEETPAADVREVSVKLVARVPDTIVAQIIALAVRGRGRVAGVSFDPDAAKAALAAADEADAVATAAQTLARRASGQAVRLRAGVTAAVSAIRTTLRGYVKTKEGASLVQANDEIRALAKQHVAARKARKTRADNAAAGVPSPAKVVKAVKAATNATKAAKAAAAAKASADAAKAAAAADATAEPSPAPKAT